jgi:hypothetical protein
MAPLLPPQLQIIKFAFGGSRIVEPLPYFSTLTLRAASLSPRMANISSLEVKIIRYQSGQYQSMLGQRMLPGTLIPRLKIPIPRLKTLIPRHNTLTQRLKIWQPRYRFHPSVL